MELACAVLSSTALIGTAAASAVALAPSRYAWVAPGAVCFLSLVLALLLARLVLLAPIGSAARRWAKLGACYHTVAGLALCSCLVPLPHAILAWVAAAAYAVGLYCYLAKRCPPEESCVR